MSDNETTMQTRGPVPTDAELLRMTLDALLQYDSEPCECGPDHGDMSQMCRACYVRGVLAIADGAREGVG